MVTAQEQYIARMLERRGARNSDARRNVFGGIADTLRSVVPTISQAASAVNTALTPTQTGQYQTVAPNASAMTGLLGAANTGNTTVQTVDVGPQAVARFQAEQDAKRREQIQKDLQAFKKFEFDYDAKQKEAELIASYSSDGEERLGSPFDRQRARETAIREFKVGGKDYATTLKEALNVGVDLRPYYGETYADAVKFKQDLGQYAGKDESMIIPANPVGYGGKFKFDPNFGSAYYRDLATQAGKALGLSDEQILQKGTEYFKDKFASGAKTAGVIGFTDFGGGLIDNLATTAGVPTERLPELKGTVLKPLYDASSKVFQGLNGAARIESQSSGFFKGIGQDLAKLGPIGTIALTAALGPAAGALAGSLGGGAALATGLAAGGASALPGLLQGDISGAIKSGLTGGALAGIGAGALKGIGSNVSDALGGGSVGNIAGGAAQGAIRGGVGSLLSGGDLGQGLLSGGLFGAGTTAGAELLGQTGNALDQSRRANQEFFGLNPNAKSPTIDFGNPQNFGPTFDLPNTIGALAGAPSIGGLFDDVEFPGMGLNPNATGLLDLGSGLGQGLTIPTSPNVPGQLGQGLTVRVPGGTLGQGGVTPTGQITLGNPNSFINGGTQGSSSGFDVSKLLRGLLGAGTAAAVGGGIANALRGSPQQQQTQQALPVQRFSMNPQTFNYTGDPAKYGETDIGNFQFYKPNMGLLG